MKKHYEDTGHIVKTINERKQALGYSYQDIAIKTGMSKSTIQRYATGDIGNIPLDKLEVLASALEISPSQLLGWREKSPSADIALERIREGLSILTDDVITLDQAQSFVEAFVALREKRK